MQGSLVDRTCRLINLVVDTERGAWLVWCDSRRDWLPLIQRAAEAGSFTLLQVEEQTQGEIGGPASRHALQEQINQGQPFVLWVPAPADRLGWLWGQALLAERIYDRPLREQLREWGWRPDRLTITDDELAALARRNLDREPAEWGAGGLEPDLGLLLDVLAGGAASPSADQHLVLDLTVERAGLPELVEAESPRMAESRLGPAVDHPSIPGRARRRERSPRAADLHRSPPAGAGLARPLAG